MKSKGIKKSAITCGVLAAASVLVGGVTLFNAQAATDVEKAIAAYQMIDGAAVRLSATGDNAKSENGLKYTVSLSKTQYQLLKDTYSDITFGVLIAPEEWLIEGYELTEENVFGENACYGYATWNGSEWVYDGTKPQIVNLSSTIMKVSADDSTVMEYAGSMVAIRDGSDTEDTTNNLTREFRGVGYISYTVGEATEYVFVGDDDNVRSMTYVAQKAIEDTKSDLTTTEREWLQTNYVDKVTNEATTYQVAHYVQNASGAYALKETETISENVTIDDAATATPKTYAGYTYNEEKSVTAGKVYANGKLCLNLYYDRMAADVTKDLGLIDVTAQNTLDLTEYASYIGETELYLVSTGAVAEANITENALSVSGLNGAYVLRLSSEEGIAELSFDAYDPMAAVEWNEVTDGAGRVNGRFENDLEATTVSVVEATALPEGLETEGTAFKVTGGAEAFSFGFAALHSAAYYEDYTEIGVELTFDYYVSAEQKADATAAIKYARVALAGDTLWTDVTVGEWHSVTLLLDTIITDGGETLIEWNGDFYQEISVSEEWGSLGTLTYEGVGGAVGGVNACTNAEWYFANFKFGQGIGTIDGGEKMIDLNGLSDLSFEGLLLNEKQRGLFETYETMGELAWTIDGKAAADATNVDGYFEVVATLTVDTEQYDVYLGNVDFYDSADGLVWQPTSGLTVDDLVVKGYTTCEGVEKSVVTTELPTGAAATEYYKIYNPQQSAGNMGWSASVLAAHSKAYYEAWEAKATEKGFTLNVQYDFYYVGDNNGKAGDYWACRNAYNLNGAVQKRSSTWITETMPFAKMMEQWDNHSSLTQNYWDYNMMYIEDARYYGAELTVYWGNFRTALVSGEAIDYTDTVTLKDVKDQTTFDLSTLISEEDKATLGDIGGYGWYLNGKAVENPVSTASLEGVYEVSLGFEVYPYAATVYKTTVDFYDSSDGLVWQPTSGLSLDNLYVKQYPACEGITTAVVSGDDLPAGATATEYYKIYNPQQSAGSMGWSASVTAIHSKEYYQWWTEQAANKNATFNVKFDFYTIASKNGNEYSVLQDHNVFAWSGETPKTRTWNTDTMTLAKMLEKWDKLSSSTQTSYEHNMVYIMDAQYSGAELTVFWGNFRTELVVADTIDNTASVELKDLKDQTTFDLQTLEDLTSLGDISGYTWYVNGVAQETSVVDTANLEGVYEVSLGLELYSYSAILYKATVDFYDSADGMVWQRADNLSLEYLHVKNEGGCVGITEELDTPDGKDGTYYKVYNPQQDGSNKGFSISVSALHSKEYYETLWADSADQKWVVEYEVCAEVYADGVLKGNSFQYQWKWTSGTAGSGWVTFTVDLSVLIANWNNLSNDSVTGYYKNMIQNENAVYYGREHTMWMGNFNSKQVEVSAS